MSNSEVDLLYTIIYLFFSLCLIAPPNEFVSAGLTVQNLLSNFLGSEDLNFIYYHIRRSTATVIVHSLFPLGKLKECYPLVYSQIRTPLGFRLSRLYQTFELDLHVLVLYFKNLKFIYIYI